MKKLFKKNSCHRRKRGEAQVETVVKVIIAVVVGALLFISFTLVSLNAMNGAQDRVNGLFNLGNTDFDAGSGTEEEYSDSSETSEGYVSEYYIEFQSEGPFTINTSIGKTWSGILEYSTDTNNWDEWDGSEVSGPDGRLYFRGIGNVSISCGPDFNTYDYQTYNQWIINSESGVSCYGNIENLLDYELVAAGEHPSMGAYSFIGMFYGCDALKSAPELPAKMLSYGCYARMFENCSSLMTPPSLPAEILTPGCYYHMFAGCSSLMTAPELPAECLTENCYDSMFLDCESLIVAPQLPAMELANYCYCAMFMRCELLTFIPELPATNLKNSCYMYMFQGCISLTYTPELPATVMASWCYANMFNGCSLIETAPELPATVLANNCYDHMFTCCYSLIEASELPAINLSIGCYNGMFSGCYMLTRAPALPATTLAYSCYSNMFYGCTNLKVSATQTGAYQYEWRIPTEGTISSTPLDWNTNMLTSTGGTFTGNPAINTTYYLEYPPVG